MACAVARVSAPHAHERVGPRETARHIVFEQPAIEPERETEVERRRVRRGVEPSRPEMLRHLTPQFTSVENPSARTPFVRASDCYFGQLMDVPRQELRGYEATRREITSTRPSATLSSMRPSGEVGTSWVRGVEHVERRLTGNRLEALENLSGRHRDSVQFDRRVLRKAQRNHRWPHRAATIEPRAPRQIDAARLDERRRLEPGNRLERSADKALSPIGDSRVEMSRIGGQRPDNHLAREVFPDVERMAANRAHRSARRLAGR